MQPAEQESASRIRMPGTGPRVSSWTVPAKGGPGVDLVRFYFLSIQFSWLSIAVSFNNPSQLFKVFDNLFRCEFRNKNLVEFIFYYMTGVRIRVNAIQKRFAVNRVRCPEPDQISIQPRMKHLAPLHFHLRQTGFPKTAIATDALQSAFPVKLNPLAKTREAFSADTGRP